MGQRRNCNVNRMTLIIFHIKLKVCVGGNDNYKCICFKRISWKLMSIYYKRLEHKQKIKFKETRRNEIIRWEQKLIK